MRRDARPPVVEAVPEEQGCPADRETYRNILAMPQEDDPGDDGHMWSGKNYPPDDRPEDEPEVGAPGHLPTHQTGPLPF